jgi:hypothetical protein
MRCGCLAPAVDTARASELLFEATDRTGLATRIHEVIRLSPVSRSGQSLHVEGTTGCDGLHWVITGDGFTADQQQDLVRAAIAMSKGVTDAPELARHAAILNIHVLTAISRDSAWTPAPRGYAQNGVRCRSRLHRRRTHRLRELGQGPRRVDRRTRAVRRGGSHPQHDTYAGSATASGLIVSRHPKAPAITLHEMGHLLAGLGDEYVDEALAGDVGGKYREGMFANVTTLRIPRRFRGATGSPIPSAYPRRPAKPVLAASRRLLLGQRVLPPEAEQHHEVPRRRTGRSERRGVAAQPVSRRAAAERRLSRAASVGAPAGADVDFEIVSPWPRN